jgi:hypothetical protein
MTDAPTCRPPPEFEGERWHWLLISDEPQGLVLDEWEEGEWRAEVRATPELMAMYGFTYSHPCRPDDATVRAQLEVENARLRALINTPVVDDWFDGVRIEAAHQQERWGSSHDAGKSDLDWFWLIGYLAQKVVSADTTEKALHHTISTAAALFNWHQAISGVDTRMRPGIEPPDGVTGEGE